MSATDIKNGLVDIVRTSTLKMHQILGRQQGMRAQNQINEEVQKYHDSNKKEPVDIEEFLSPKPPQSAGEKSDAQVFEPTSVDKQGTKTTPVSSLNKKLEALRTPSGAADPRTPGKKSVTFEAGSPRLLYTPGAWSDKMGRPAAFGTWDPTQPEATPSRKPEPPANDRIVPVAKDDITQPTLVDLTDEKSDNDDRITSLRKSTAGRTDGGKRKLEATVEEATDKDNIIEESPGKKQKTSLDDDEDLRAKKFGLTRYTGAGAKEFEQAQGAKVYKHDGGITTLAAYMAWANK